MARPADDALQLPMLDQVNETIEQLEPGRVGARPVLALRA